MLVHAISYAHAGVEALRSDICECVVHAELDMDVGIVSQQGQQPRLVHGGDGVVVGRDAHGARRLVSQCSEGPELQSDLIEPGCHRFQ